jgi:hypothetical protein
LPARCSWRRRRIPGARLHLRENLGHRQCIDRAHVDQFQSFDHLQRQPKHCAIQPGADCRASGGGASARPQLRTLHSRFIHSFERRVILAIVAHRLAAPSQRVFGHVPVNSGLTESNRPDDAVSLGSILYVEIDGSACPVQDRCSPFRMCRADSKLQQKCEPSGFGNCARADRDFGDDR